jgi:molybdopterin-guanine dinucleotide biosynthesis protein A
MTDGPAIVAVLAGGRGRRLGGAKPTAALAGRPLVWHALQAAAGAGLDAVVVAKASTGLPSLQVPVLVEPEEPRHPLCGLVTALRFAAEARRSAVVALACDMPFVTAPLLAWLAALEGAAMAQVGDRPQPLLARVPVGGLTQMERALADGLALRDALARLAPSILAEQALERFGDPQRLCFNVNDLGDLRQADEWLGSKRG